MLRRPGEHWVFELPAAAWGGALGALLAAALDARALSASSGVGWGAAFWASFGLIAPLALALSGALGVARAVLIPQAERARLVAYLRGAHAERSAVFALAPLAAALWLVCSARIALFVLASGLSPAAAGAALASATLLSAALFASAVWALSPALARRIGGRARPLFASLLSVGAALLLLASAIASGPASGAGGAFAMFGVLTRDELDLRPLAGLAVIALAASCAPRPASRLTAAFACVLALAPLAATALDAARWLDERTLALGIERSAPLASKLLGRFQRLSDHDRDGYSARFGGGDCNDARADINPAAEDVPDNGLDEDCSGSDAHAGSTASPAKDNHSTELAGDARARALDALPQKLNVLLLTVDTLRADLGYAGNPRTLSPRLDELAREAVVFEKAYSLASYTAKSLPPLLIGRYSSETHRGYSHFNRFEAADTFVAERLQRAGIHTLSVQGHWYFYLNYGMERGFERIDTSAAPRALQAAEGDRSITSERLSDAVIAELARPGLGEQPFFMWAHYTDPHAEYVVHPGFEFGTGSRAAYDSEVAFVDHHLGRVLDALRKSPLWANTAVIVTSDHGEAFGEHAMIRHGFELWEELVRVPLVVRMPGTAPHRVQVRRGAIDLVPTLLDLFRQPIPQELPGTSLLLDLALPPGYSPEPRPVFIDMAEGPHNAERRALIVGDEKLVVSGGRALGLFDLALDPEEKHDLSADRARLEAALERYRAFRRGLHEVRVKAP